LALAVLGLLAVQFCFLALIAWKMLIPDRIESQSATPEYVALLEETVDSLVAARRREADVDAKTAVLNEVVGKISPDGQGLVNSLVEKNQEVGELRSSVRGQQSLLRELDSAISDLQRDLEGSQLREERLVEKYERLQTVLIGERQTQDKQRQELALLSSRLAKYEDPPQEADAAAQTEWYYNRVWLSLGGTLLVLAVCGSVAAFLRYKKGTLDFQEDAEEGLDSTNNL
jgi:chromosome segregation ATPase